jgi:hypothetical protein
MHLPDLDPALLTYKCPGNFVKNIALIMQHSVIKISL